MASVCLPRNYTERENSDFGRYCVGKSCTPTLMLIAVTRRSKKISGAPKMISADDPDALGTRRDTTTLITPGAASQRDPDVSPHNGPPANNDTELAPRLSKLILPLPE
jgi:hypothetical protein